MLVYGAWVPGWRTLRLSGYGWSRGSSAPLWGSFCDIWLYPLISPLLLVPGRCPSIPSIKATAERAHSVLLTHV